MTTLAVTNDKRQRGANSLADAVPPLELLDFEAVFDREFTSDVHFVTYGLREPHRRTLSKDPFPRINKPALGQIREKGGEVVTVALVMDFDLKDQDGAEDLEVDSEGKPIWTRELLAEFGPTLLAVDAALAEKGIAAPIVYTTTHGARFVHRLAAPVPCDEAEDLLRGLRKVYLDIGLVMDELYDWTRLFRAPKVVRDGNKTWEARWFFMRWSTELTLAEAIDPISKIQHGRDQVTGKIVPITADRPSPEDSFARLMRRGEDGKLRRTQMAKDAEKILKGTPAYGPCFDNQPLSERGEVHKTMLSLVGSATSFLLGPLGQAKGGFEPEDIYAIFAPAVEVLDNGPEHLAALWRQVKSCYEKEKARLAVVEQQKEERREQAAEVAVDLLETVRRYCNIPELHSEDAYIAHEALRKLMLLKEPSGRYRALCTEGPSRGGYSRIAVPQGSLHHLLGQVAKLDDHIARFAEDKNGDVKPISEQALARRATDVARVTGGVGFDLSHVSGETWDDLTLQLVLYRRNPLLEPEYNEAVAEWLEMLTDDPTMLKRWLSRALDFEGGPICALSLAGSPGAGKGMLAQGLVETLERPLRASKEALVTDFNDSMRHTPFLIVDEGLPKGRHDIADKFRQLTAGDPVLTEEKFQTPIEIRNPMRILFCANNLDIVAQLASERMNQSKDQAALAIRLLHLNVTDAPAMHLNAMGGLGYTKGWVEGSGGQKSEFVVAKHLLWLYEHRDQFGEAGKRFLVEGRAQNKVVQRLRTAGNVPEAIAVAIITALENPHSLIVRRGLAISDGRLFVTAKAVLDQHRSLRDERETNVHLTAGKVSQAMSNLCSPGVEASSRAQFETLNGETHRESWWDVDVRLLHSYAEDAGFKRETLRRLLIAQYGTEADE